MNILVIGGSYFLGKEFVEQAAGSHTITVLNRGSRRVRWSRPEAITEMRADRHDKERLKGLFGEAEQVAGQPEGAGQTERAGQPEGAGRTERAGQSEGAGRTERAGQTERQGRAKNVIYDVVVDFCAYQPGDIRTLLELLEGRVKQYIFVSTCDVYRRGTGRETDETGELESRDFGGEAGAYILGKAALERELAECAKQYQVFYTSIRPAFIYGPDNYAPRESIFFQWILKAGQVLYPKDADGFFQMVYVKDVAGLIMDCCGREDAYDQAFNICGEGTWDYARYVECLENVVCDMQDTVLPDKSCKAGEIEKADKIGKTDEIGKDEIGKIEKVEISVADVEARGIPLPFPLTRAESELYSDAKARELGIEYTPAEAGMRETFQWFLESVADGGKPGQVAGNAGEGGRPYGAGEQNMDGIVTSGNADEANGQNVEECAADGTVTGENADGGAADEHVRNGHTESGCEGGIQAAGGIGLDIAAILQKVDELFDENKAKEAEQLLLHSLDQANQAGDGAAQLQLLNELIGYYRQTSEREQLLWVIEEAMQTAQYLGLEGSIPYATTALNAANGYRSIGELQKSLEYYRATEEIYKQQMPEHDMRMAGLLNNISLLYQEMGDYETAGRYLKRALVICEQNQAGFEIAVTYANLANTCVLAESYGKAAEYAQTAIALFEKRNLYDAHYCAALSALGMCHYEFGRFDEAEQLFSRGMELVENSLGKNRQYERLKENRDMCRRALSDGEGAENTEKMRKAETAGTGMVATAGTETAGAAGTVEKAGNEIMEPTAWQREKLQIEAGSKARAGNESRTETAGEERKAMTGLELCKKYYETYGKPALEKDFAQWLPKIATGLVGRGSDCFGYDDEASRDHDWGPDFCIWVTDETYAEIGEKLEEMYAQLPKEFMGYKRAESPWGAKDPRGEKRRGVMTIAEFYRGLVGAADYEDIDWQSVEDHGLAAAVNGEVYRDDEGIFSSFREKLKTGYPERILYLKLAEDAAKFAQTGEYNYGRMLKRGDRMTADRMLCECLGHAMKLAHHMWGLYPPHDKWLYKNSAVVMGNATGGDNDNTLLRLLDALHGCLKMPDAEALAEGTGAAEQLGEYLARELYARSFISDVDSYLDMHTEELLMKASVAGDSNDGLVDRIVKLEFEAFDKVKNEGGRAYCQNDWPTFSVMRKSQYLTWNRTMLLQYLYDFDREYRRGHNLITEKYARMMESTTPERFQEMAENFPELTEQQKVIIDQIVAVQMNMMEEFAKEHPKVAGNARNLHTYEDNIVDTSYETYLRGEISTYSDKMLQLYGQHVVRCAANGVNIAREIIENTARLYGYADLEKFEASILD